ncbi:Swt1 family HEPN domain-containing protein [Streptosporangium sandarakinum]|uniref:Putative AAA+ superfamily ATPase n=1 Tax=Streptosporangium sandarakinum TaxID=1260955 RepID=A0A852UXL0_9ACTN|nr:Swt1 family HEPN domain-containing protein [Streptosporangium sandarakinum]NYF42162.1 putative AAA+ superfamily ATPase [Streptosporangium sandarakinum]
MALSNRDRIGRGLEILGKGLEPFVELMMSMATTGSHDWLQVIEARDAAKHGVNRSYEKTDVRFLLRVLTEEWRVFKDRLSRVEQNFASELREVGNKWAHTKPFSGDDTYRALDTMERLLTAIGAMDRADEVRKLRLDHQRGLYDSEARRAAQSVTSMPVVEANGLKSWREVITPHTDVQRGKLDAAEFAADLHMVSIGESTGEEYSDPVQFFRRTYLTEGLKDLLKRAVERVGGDMNATPVWNLQTNFGGGKTHSMLALWHIFSGTPLHEFPQEVVDLLQETDARVVSEKVNRAALVGNHIDPKAGKVKEDGTHVRTLWGELAWQLGGREAYEIVRESDQAHTNPGDALRRLLAAYSPCLVLIDEWVAYARQLYGREDLEAGTFDTQFTFAQTITEAAKAVPGALLVVSIPASSHKEAEEGIMGSALEVGGVNGQAALDRLQNVIRRVAQQWQPARAHESFEIVRRRLFEEPSAAAKAEIAAIAKQFWKFYNDHKGEFPRECSEVAYEKRIIDAYPIHPELFDRLYEDWSTLDRFQRTRGVLRLMSMVIQRLWQSQDAGPLIMPGSLPLNDPKVVGELAQYLQDNWKAVLETDVDSETATPVQIDGERTVFGKRALTRRLARTLFFGSAPTLTRPHKGIEQQNIRLGVALPGDVVGNFGSALHVLTDRATFLYVDGFRYWYDTQASVTRTAKDYAERLHKEDVWLEIVKRLRAKELKTRGDFSAVHVTDDGAEVPDTGDARLVILHPSVVHAKNDRGSSAMVRAQEILDKRSSAQRINRNMLVFLAGDAKRMEELAEAVREYLAWKNITDRRDELDLTVQQIKQVETRLANADQAVELRIRETYYWALVPAQAPGAHITWQMEKADGSKERLAERVSAKLRQIDALRVIQAASVIRGNLDNELASVWQRGHISIKELWDYYCRYPYLPRLRGREVLEGGIVAGLDEIDWERTGFALATGYDGERFEGLVLPSRAGFGQVTDGTLLVRPDLAVAQRDAEERARAEAEAEAARRAGETGGSTTGDADGSDTDGGRSGSSDTDTGPRPDPEKPKPGPKNVRFFGATRLDPEFYQKSFTKLAQEVIQHLAAAEGVELELSIEITARKADGFPEDKVRIVSENARVLKFDQFGFEDR